MANCCDDELLVAVQECYSIEHECLSLTNYATACGCCGEKYILADLNGGAEVKHCTTVKIVGDKSGGGFELMLKSGCDSHTVTFCKTPTTAAEWQSFVYSTLATDAFVLTNNLQVSILAAGEFSISLKMCGECPVSATGIALKSGVTKVEATATLADDTTPKLGQFLQYGFESGVLSGVQTLDKGSYAGFLMLPDSVPSTACCVPDTCDCAGAGSCRKILLVGETLIPLATPFPAAGNGRAQLATKPDGSIVAYYDTVPAGAVALPVPHTIVFNESTIGSNLVTVVLH